MTSSSGSKHLLADLVGDGQEEVMKKLVEWNAEIAKLDKEVIELQNQSIEKTKFYLELNAKKPKWESTRKTKNQRKKHWEWNCAVTNAAKEVHAINAKMVEISAKKREIAYLMVEHMGENIKKLDDLTTDFKSNLVFDQDDDPERPTSSREMRARSQHRRNLQLEELELELPAVMVPDNPHEPRFCICNSVSSGEMIACDNPNCKYEWFHFDCIGMKKAPTGSYVCKHCKENGFALVKKRNN